MIRLVAAIWLIALLLFVASRLASTRMVLNHSESAPLGVWSRLPVPANLARGTWVLVCPPDSDQFRAARSAGVVPHGVCPDDYEPLVKKIAAVAGDSVDIEDAGVRVNGVLLADSRPVVAADKAFARPQPAGHYVVAPGACLLLNEHSRSWDSRYFGALSTSTIQATLRPLATYGEGR